MRRCLIVVVCIALASLALIGVAQACTTPKLTRAEAIKSSETWVAKHIGSGECQQLDCVALDRRRT
jgi:hypothetical protein